MRSLRIRDWVKGGALVNNVLDCYHMVRMSKTAMEDMRRLGWGFPPGKAKQIMERMSEKLEVSYL